MTTHTTASSRPGFPKRLAFAGANLLTPLHTGLIVAYYAVRLLGGAELWVIDAFSYILPWLFAPLLVLLPVNLVRRSRVLMVLVVIPILLFLLTYGSLYLPRLWVDDADAPFTVMAYNVLFRNPYPSQVIAEIEAHNPDMIGLYELEPAMAQALEDRLADQYPYRQVIEHACGLFSRYPILQCESFRMGQGENEGPWAQQCVLEIEGREVTVLNVHPRSPPLIGFHPFGLPLGIPTGFYNQGRDTDLLNLLTRIEQVDGPLIVIGDLNMTDQQSLYRPLTERLHDAHREAGWGMGFTFTRFPSIGLPMWRIDYVLTSTDLVALDAGVGGYGGSDHRPIIARLGFRVPEE